MEKEPILKREERRKEIPLASQCIFILVLRKLFYNVIKYCNKFFLMFKIKGEKMSFNNDRRGFGGPREMHKATCADCGKECEVPFKPTEGRPVYCRDCFQKHRK